MNPLKPVYQELGPYPEIGEMQKNPYYAKEMLSNVGGANSEMTAISLYIYNNIFEQDRYEDISAIFQGIAKVEMHHLVIFGTLARKLGEDPRLWAEKDGKMVCWTPTYNDYPTEFPTMIQNALEGELAAIDKYKSQASMIKDETIVSILLRIIKDEEVHVKIFEDILEEYFKRNKNDKLS